MSATRYCVLLLVTCSALALAQTSASLSIQLKARVQPRISLEASAPIISGGSGTLTVAAKTEQGVRFEGAISGEGNAVAIAIPLSIRGNIANFLLRVNVQGVDAAGLLQTERDSSDEGIRMLKVRSLAANDMILPCTRPPGQPGLVPVVRRLTLFLDSIPAGTSSKVMVEVRAEPLRR